MSDYEKIRSMTLANVPRACWNVSAKGTGRQHYADYAMTLRELQDVRDLHPVCLVRYQNATTGLLDVEMVAKQMVLAGIQTRYATFANIGRDLRLEENGVETQWSWSTIFGRGAIVVPLIPDQPKDMETVQARQYAETLEYLEAHAYSGGILVVGIQNLVAMKFPATFKRLLTENSKVFEAK